ncbi:MAG TPA: HD domain-containing phosphohydrolase [Polyangiaceae bacterium]|jgi:HD-GYP domain-containing protein (c-di-GMP phosphodiesterase class II)|nr:HD domain-containing phosphohydrolase [Polyangiaceae bacterium]
MISDLSSAEAKSIRFEALHRIGVALSKERDRDRLVESILLEAKHLCNADGGTLYLVDKPGRELDFAMIHSDSLKIAQGGSTGNPINLPSIPLFLSGDTPNRNNVATRAYHDQVPVHVPDAYAPGVTKGIDLSGTHAFDRRNNYRSVSLLAIPLSNSQGSVIAVLQLINATDPNTGQVTPFHPELERTVIALAAQAGIALDNQALLAAHRELLDSFIKLIAAAIDAKSPYTGDHCERVPVLAEMFTRALCEVQEGPFAGFKLTDEEWRELRVAAWLHDCGKVTTPTHVMDKATKLETISDRILVVEARYEVLARDAELDYFRAISAGRPEHEASLALETTRKQLSSELTFLRGANIGGEFLSPEARARIQEIGARTIVLDGKPQPLLDQDMVKNLSIARGTLTEDERVTINGHMVQTIRMLEALPFPAELARVPEYAGGHHERMDGKGYPKGLFAGDMSIPARVLAIADVFEALTAADRPYKKGKTLSESMRIMGQMKKANHLDPELFDEFVRSKVYLKYAEAHCAKEQIDSVDEAALLAIRPEPYTLPEREIRDARRRDFLPEYKRLLGG